MKLFVYALICLTAVYADEDHPLVRVTSPVDEYPEAACPNGFYPVKCKYDGKKFAIDVLSNGRACFTAKACLEGCSVVAYCADTHYLHDLSEKGMNVIKKGSILKMRNRLREEAPYAACPPGFEVILCSLSSGFDSEEGSAIHGRTCYANRKCDSEHGCYIRARCEALDAIHKKLRRPSMKNDIDFKEIQGLDTTTKEDLKAKITDEMLSIRNELKKYEGLEKQKALARLSSLHRLHCELRDEAKVTTKK